MKKKSIKLNNAMDVQAQMFMTNVQSSENFVKTLNLSTFV